MKKKEMTCCPHCGSTRGVFTKTTYVNVPFNMDFTGTAQYNGEMFDNAEDYTGGKIAYCQECGRPICRLSTLLKKVKSGQ